MSPTLGRCHQSPCDWGERRDRWVNFSVRSRSPSRPSGSTGRPREVALSAVALRSAADASAERLGGHGGWLLALPVEHIAGVQVVVRSIIAGRAPATLPPGATFTAAAFAAAAATLAAPRRYTSLVPTQLHRLVPAEPEGTDALRAFDAVLVGGHQA